MKHTTVSPTTVCERQHRVGIPYPVNETQRLAALRRTQLLDTPAEDVYDDIVRSAAELCDTPISLVSLVDEDRQWFKAKTGIDADQTPRTVAFCAHAICSDELMEVPDAHSDRRFATNPLVLDAPNVRFYAGAPLRASAGYSYGTLCVIDTVPRTLTDDQRDGLNRLARQVTVLLELREAVSRLDETCRELASAHLDRDHVEERLRYQAHHDALTGLPNRTLLMERVEAAFADDDADRHPLAMLICDVDNFKVVNDGLGHPAGDRLLAEIARRLRSCVRENDTVARFGGDEFVVLVDNADRDSVASLAERMLTDVAAPFTLGGHDDFRPAISVGLAFRSPGVSGDQLLSNADAAMYQSKSMGGGRVSTFDAAVEIQVLDQLVVATDLGTAVSNDELFCLFQPQITIATGELFGLESLIRWNHPTRGTLRPALFVPALEDSNRIGEAFDRVLDLTLDAQACWLRESGRRPTVAVNLSARQLGDADLTDTIQRALQRHTAPPSSLRIELTESALLTAPSLRVLDAIQLSGVQLVIDNFGVGWSSLARLSMFPWDLLTIDRSFIDAIGRERNAEKVVRGIVSLAHSMGIRTVAEGVQTVEQMDLLARVGCDVAQGNLIAGPLPASEVSRHLTRRSDRDRRVTGITWNPRPQAAPMASSSSCWE